MAALVYQVSCGSRGHLWFADGVEAEAAAQEILRGGEAVGLFPVSVPETAREFVAFVESYRPRRPYASGGIVRPGSYTVAEVAPARAAECAVRLEHALQWLLDSLHDAGETHDEDGSIFDAVEDAAAALVEAGGHLNWYSVEDAEAYRAREGSA